MTQSERLSNLVSALPGDYSLEGGDTEITGIVLDSRRVDEGKLFVAITGGATDGHRYIPDAIQRGAGAIAGTQSLSGLPVPYVKVEDSRHALAYLSSAYYGFPARRLCVIGVTGTDGKTTTTTLVFNILKAAGLRAGMISTVNAVIGEETLETGFHVTTPDAPDVQRYLSLMVESGLSHVVLEATSHGLAQHRVTACEFDIAVVTNISHEHLDFHGTYQAYREAKGRLFSGLINTSSKVIDTPRAAVLNLDDQSYYYLCEISKVQQLSYGCNLKADIQAESIEDKTDGISFVVSGNSIQHEAFRFPIFTPLIGGHNVSNCLAAITVTRGVLDIPDEIVQQGIREVKGIPGRMEKIDMGQEFDVFVDFAHTPNALLKALESARELSKGRVIAVFGSAGLRDRAKRRMMAEVSAKHADLTILTAEDPRTESLGSILEEMNEGFLLHKGIEGKNYWRIADRRDAIRFAFRIAIKGDIVIVCGKGHEQSMCFGNQEYLWDDRTACRAALSEQLGIPGPDMPYLPDWD